MCALAGSDTVIGWIKTKLGIGPGETTTDGLFTLSAVECLAACGTAPMMQVNEDYYERLTEERFDKILADLKQNGTTTSAVPMYSFSDFNKLIGFEEVWEFERRYAESD